MTQVPPEHSLASNAPLSSFFGAIDRARRWHHPLPGSHVLPFRVSSCPPGVAHPL